MIGAVVRYAMAIGWVESDPTIALRGALMAPPKKPGHSVPGRCFAAGPAPPARPRFNEAGALSPRKIVQRS